MPILWGGGVWGNSAFLTDLSTAACTIVLDFMLIFGFEKSVCVGTSATILLEIALEKYARFLGGRVTNNRKLN